MARVLAAVLLVVGAYFVYLSVSWNRKFDRWLVEEPVRLRLDLSHSGTFKAPFRQTCAIAHAQSVELEPVNPKDLERVRQVVEEASIEIRLVRTGGKRDVAELEDPVGHPSREGMVRYARLRPVPNGEYAFTAVVQRAPEVMPLPVDLVVRNDLCGCETLPATFSLVIGCVVLFFGAVAMLFAWTDPFRRTEATTVAKPSPPP